jgi:hypothetical protein
MITKNPLNLRRFWIDNKNKHENNKQPLNNSTNQQLTIMETGHAVNVGNFRKLIGIIVLFGARYAPAIARLQLTALNALLTEAVQALGQLDERVPPWLRAVNARVAAFEPLNLLVTRVLAYAEAVPLNPTALRALKELIRKIRGQRAKAKELDVPVDPETGEPTHKYISVSQLSFEQRIEHFNQIVELLKAEPDYTPNEGELSTTGLSERLEAMRTTNTAVEMAADLVGKARSDRNRTLYAPTVGLVDVGYDVKKYVRGAFGPKSDEYRKVKGIKFTKK